MYLNQAFYYASSAVYANDVTVAVTSGGGAESAPVSGGGGMRPGMFGGQTEDTPSTKAVKAGADMQISGGEYTLDSADDGLHSDGSLSISGGSFTISSGDDAVHAEGDAVIGPESINISSCCEGIEGAYITINGGSISIIASDDAINAVGSEPSAGFGGGGPGGMSGGGTKTAEEDIYLTINGGSLYIETSGDGIDSNGSAVINGGNAEVYGPDNSGNSSIDIGDGGYALIMNGGSLLAAGSSGMAEYPYSGSGQSSLVFYLDETYAAGSEISVCASSGNEIISGVSGRNFDFVCVSAADIEQGETYVLYVNSEETASIEASPDGGEMPDGEPGGDMVPPESAPESPGDVDTAESTQSPDAGAGADGAGMRRGGPGGDMGGAMQAEQTGQSASGAVSSVLSFVREYTTPIVSLVLLAAAFVFVKLYKRRRY